MINKIEEAITTLANAMKEDPEYAYSWHCNLALMAHDAGAPIREANKRAEYFMMHVFGISGVKEDEL